MVLTLKNETTKVNQKVHTLQIDALTTVLFKKTYFKFNILFYLENKFHIKTNIMQKIYTHIFLTQSIHPIPMYTFYRMKRKIKIDVLQYMSYQFSLQ